MIATYKKNEIKRLHDNLLIQNFNYFNPKIRTKRHNLLLKEEPMFPGYIFIHADTKNYQKIKYTKGISKIIRFNKNIAILNDDEIEELRRIQDHSFSEPISPKVYIGQETTMTDGPLKGSLVTIASMPRKDRVNIFIHILGTKRRISASLNEINI